MTRTTTALVLAACIAGGTLALRQAAAADKGIPPVARSSMTA